MNGPGRRRGAKPVTAPQRTGGRVTASIRYAAAAAERYLGSSPGTPDAAEQDSEFDDAPRLVDIPEWQTDEDDDLVIEDDDTDHFLRPSLLPWVRVSIYVLNGALEFRVHVPESRDPDIARSLDLQYQAWTKTARDKLIPHQSAALRKTNRLEALLALDPYSMKDLERSVGQGSRDRRVLVSTPFGLAPLWFFAMGRDDDLFKNLTVLGRQLQDQSPREYSTEAGRSVRADVIRSILPRLTRAEQDSIRSAHCPTLAALLQRPEVLAAHLARWPRTSPESLVDDLGLTGRSGRSTACAALALAGAFDSDESLRNDFVLRPRPLGIRP